MNDKDERMIRENKELMREIKLSKKELKELDEFYKTLTKKERLELGMKN